MPRLSSSYCGIARYFANSADHAESLIGGITPDTGCHSVMESPLSVRRVAPPIRTSSATITAQSASQRPIACVLSVEITEFHRKGSS